MRVKRRYAEHPAGVRHRRNNGGIRGRRIVAQRRCYDTEREREKKKIIESEVDPILKRRKEETRRGGHKGENGYWERECWMGALLLRERERY